MTLSVGSLVNWMRPSSFARAAAALRATKHVTPSRLPHWSSPGRPSSRSLADVRGMLRAMADAAPSLPPLKGRPHLHSIKRELAAETASALDAGGPAQALGAAHRSATVDMFDPTAFDVYLDLVGHASSDAFSAARELLTENVVVHLSCADRVARAQESRRSFEPAQARGVSQVIVVGSAGAQTFEFDRDTSVLTVPAPDTYEHLPAKVVAAMFFLSLCGGVEAVLKVDDDHRLGELPELIRGFAKVRSRRPVQSGFLTDIGVLGQHERVWHFGKTSDPDLSRRPFSLPGTTRWLNGASGYFLNGQALRLLLWSHVYFPEYIRVGLYEDITVSDLIERQGGRLKETDMTRMITAVDHY